MSAGLSCVVPNIILRYCLDKNYGGWLSIWDKIFGTFQEELPEEDIVYGLVDQPMFFDVIKHQLFYFDLLGTHTGSYPEDFVNIRLDLAEIFRI